MEQASVKKEKPLLLPVIAAVCAALGFYFAWFAYVAFFAAQSLPLFGDALRVLEPSPEMLLFLRCAGGLFSLAGLVCGVIGAVRSAQGLSRRAHRAKKIVGIVLSGAAILFSFFGGFEVLLSILMPHLT